MQQSLQSVIQPRPWTAYRASFIARALLYALVLPIAAVLVLNALRDPAAKAIDVGTPGDERFLVNFYPHERAEDLTFRWTSPGARLVVPNLHGGPMAMELRLHGVGPSLVPNWRLEVMLLARTLAEL